VCRPFCRLLLTAAATRLENAMQRINSVDGCHTALEIGYRSAYVPSITFGG
jgi:hypothetical protein